jgi:conjugative transposon TraM protein
MTNNNQSGNSAKQKEQLKKFAVFALMGLICAGCMYLIFSPSANKKAKVEATQGFNADIPMPKNDVIVDDKRDAYEQDMIKQRQEERMRTLQDFSAMFGDNTGNSDDGLALLTDEPAPTTVNRSAGSSRNVSQSRSQSSIQNSANTYRDMNRTLGSFYETPREDPEKERLKQELEELKNRIDETENRKNPIDEQLDFMEKSFQMAAKYMPGLSATPEGMGTMGAMGTMGMTAMPQNNNPEPAPVANNVSGKTQVAPVTPVREKVVSALLPEMSNAEFIEMYSKPRNMGFLTATAEAGAGTKNTILACIHADQTVMDGQNVRLRLLEPMQAGGVVIPRNSLLSGTARITGERLAILVNSLEHGGMIIPVEIRAYDLDGQNGIFIPNMQELKAAMEIVANMGTSAGTSINLSNDAGKQFVADMGRNAIQGVSQFTAKKLREVKVHLKADYQIFLLANK